MATLRLVEPADFHDTATTSYHADIAFLLMRDRPLVTSLNENTLMIEPAPVREIRWLARTFALPYSDNSVTITRDKHSRIFIEYNVESNKAKRGIFKEALRLANFIYATTYKDMFNVTQDALKSYRSVGAAMSQEFPQSRQFLLYGSTNDMHESFSLVTPGYSEATYHVDARISIHKNARTVTKLWTETRVSDTNDFSDRHDSVAKKVVLLRNALERYSWNHVSMEGLSSPVGWQYMDSL